MAIAAISAVDRFDAVPVFVSNLPVSIPIPIPDKHNPPIAIPAEYSAVPDMPAVTVLLSVDIPRSTSPIPVSRSESIVAVCSELPSILASVEL